MGNCCKVTNVNIYVGMLTSEGKKNYKGPGTMTTGPAVLDITYWSNTGHEKKRTANMKSQTFDTSAGSFA